MGRELAANKEIVIGKLRFDRVHGRPEDWAGKFAKQVLAQEEEVLSEIVVILTLAASLAGMLSPGIVIATLQKVLIEPTLILRPRLLGFLRTSTSATRNPGDVSGQIFWASGPAISPVGGENPLRNVSRLLHLPRSIR